MTVEVISPKCIPPYVLKFSSCFSLQNMSGFVRSCVAYFACFQFLSSNFAACHPVSYCHMHHFLQMSQE